MKGRFAKLIFVLALASTTICAFAQEVTAELSDRVTAVGQPVQLVISVSGRANKIPKQVNVDGLDIRLSGQSQQVSIVNFKMTSTAIYSYTVFPLKTGSFVIPPVTVNVAGKDYDTPELALQVVGSVGGGSMPVRPAIPVQPGLGAQPRRQPQPPPPADEPSDSQIAFGDLIIPKKSAYVGEVIPVEMRFYFNANCSVRLSDRPMFSGDDFTVMHFSKPTERQQEIDGQVYNVVVFQTAISAVKPGTLEVPSAKYESQIQVPHRNRGGGAPDDFFGGLFSGSGMGVQMREMTVETKPVSLEVKPLPSAGKPDDFLGAIGQFSLQAGASPKKADSGDPITLSVSISGRGNFDGMSPPVLQDAEAWKSYPPSEKFQPSGGDTIGYLGKKTFDFMIVARTDATMTPTPQFSYFDPETGKYVTLKASPIAVVAKGSGSPVPKPSVVAAASATPTPAPSVAAPAPAAPAKVELLTDYQPRTFSPAYENIALLCANGVAALAFLLACGLRARRALAVSSFGRRSALREEERRLRKTMQDPALSPEDFSRYTEDYLRLKLAPGQPHADPRELLVRSNAPDDVKERITALLQHGDEWRFAAGRSRATLSAEERHEVLQLLSSLQ